VTDTARWSQRDWSAIIGAKLFPASQQLSEVLYETADWSKVPSAYRPSCLEVEELGPQIASALAAALASDELLKAIRANPATDPRDEADEVAAVVIPRITMPAKGTTAYSAWSTAAPPMTRVLWIKLREYLDSHRVDLA
jgi:hypothetical protein